MSLNTDIPEPDCAEGVPHPRHAQGVIGQDAAKAQFLDAYGSGRLHHAWLITGPQGIGKATLAWEIAKFLLATPKEDGLFGAPPPPSTLAIPPDHPILRTVHALSESRLFLLRRPWDSKTDRLRTEITVDEVRKLNGFFGLSSVDGGRRVVIVDSLDEMNTSAANALLKLLEEPPADTVMLLISHQPARLLPTILSRCRRLRCGLLSAPQIAEVLAQSEIELPANPEALSALSGGSAGAAVRLINLDGLTRYAQLVALFQNGFDRVGALKLADGLAGRANAKTFDLLLELFDLFLTRLARAGVHGPGPEATAGEAALFLRLCPDKYASHRWANLQQSLSERARHGQAVNLDPAALILDITFKIHETATKMAA